MAVIYQSGGSSGGSSLIPEVTADPVSPVAGQAWVLRTTEPPGGIPIGLLLALTYTGNGMTYQLSYYTTENSIVRTDLI